MPFLFSITSFPLPLSLSIKEFHFVSSLDLAVPVYAELILQLSYLTCFDKFGRSTCCNAISLVAAENQATSRATQLVGPLDTP